MKTGAVFFGLAASVVVIGNFAEQPAMTDFSLTTASVSISPGQSSGVNVSQWRLSVESHSAQCSAQINVSDMKEVTRRAVGRCISIFPELEQFTRVEINTNGDITFFNKEGNKLAAFMETESSHHESFWPAHPLMTLALD